jgi:P27 family predicted phage terminase small subunit
MGRRRDPAEMQAAKGYPGKRRSKTDRQIAEAEALAELLAAAPAESDDALGPPALLNDARLLPALTIWRDYAPRLQKLNLFAALDRHSFAIFCVYYADFVAAQADINKNGFSRLVKTVSGDRMPRNNPAVDRRDTAVKFILEFSKRFGLTPLDRLDLIGKQAGGFNGGLFPDRPGPETGEPAKDPAGKDDSVIGIANRFDSPPPGTYQ